MSHSEKMRKEITSKLFMAESFIMSASLHPPASIDPNLRPKYAVSGHFLQSLTLELIIKMLYVLHVQQAAPFTHNIKNLFNKLDTKTKKFLNSTYDDAREKKRKIFAAINKDKPVAQQVTFPPLLKILEQNDYLVKDFKYNASAKGAKSNSAMDGEFYQKVFDYIKVELEKKFPEK